MKHAICVPAVLLMLLSIAAGCTPDKDSSPGVQEQPPETIQGEWVYVLHAKNNDSTYEYDTGTITFTGTETSGTARLINFYGYEYEGKYSVSEAHVRIEADQVWTGQFFGADSMAGIWFEENEGISGEWEAGRK